MMTALLTGVLLFSGAQSSAAERQPSPIQPYADNPRYWQYRGEPVLLIGGSKEDNLFQIPDLKEHLDLLQRVGGNYIRNTMSSRDEGNVFPYRRTDGKFDLNAWNDEYWERLRNLLELTHQRDIIVQLEVWATWDLIRDNWQDSPFRPNNNINYSSQDTTLKDNYDGVHWRDCEEKQDFFLSVPSLANDTTLLRHQHRFVDKLLSYTLQYPHVLYCMTNEIFNQYPPDWGWYWAKYIRAKAEAQGRRIYVTEMFQNHDIIDGVNHKASLDHPEIYSFVDISQNAANRDQQHWDNLRHIHRYVDRARRPINHVKTYGNNTDLAYERFFRSVLGGAASMRFHRPTSGIGLNEAAQNAIKSVRMLERIVKMWEVEAHMELLSDREPDEAYLVAGVGSTYVLYFTNGGTVGLDLNGADGDMRLRWLNIARASWDHDQTITAGRKVEVAAPSPGHWIAVMNKN